jgi:transposase
MQKALSQVNLQLHHVITDIIGDTGMRIIRAVVSGERNSQVLANYRDSRCKNSADAIEKSLTGNYRNEHIFSLKQALELFDVYSRENKHV